MLDFLTDRIIRCTPGHGKTTWASLPELYAVLMADDVEAFPALRSHQRQPWHNFLVQLGSMAVHGAGLAEPPADADEWRRIIRGLTSDWPDDEPWQLVVDDITKPAFMQPPASSKEREADYKNTVFTADELDMLVTSKGHDLKQAVAWQSDVNDWLFSVLTLQTMEGFGGARNYGISRMPSGYGNRPAFSITPSTRPGVHVRRDIMAVLEHRQSIIEEYSYPPHGGIKLVWTVPWDGERAESLLIDKMDPLYIEVCRRIRLRRENGNLVAVRANSVSRRIVDAKGLTGDPWAPVGNTPNQRGTPPAFLGPRRFGYERVVDGLMSPDWKPPYLLSPMSSERDKDMLLVARGMIRGEGRTSGYHERIIPLKPKMVRVFGRGADLQKLGDIARQRIEQVGIVKNILRHAIATFAANGDSDFNAHRNGKPSPNELAQTYANKLDEMVDDRFFDHLQQEFEADEGERDTIRKGWLRNGSDGVIDQASEILKAAEDTLPCPSVQRFKARVRADGIFWGRLSGNDGLPALFERQEEDETWESSDQTPQAQNPTEEQMTLFK